MGMTLGLIVFGLTGLGVAMIGFLLRRIVDVEDRITRVEMGRGVRTGPSGKLGGEVE